MQRFLAIGVSILFWCGLSSALHAHDTPPLGCENGHESTGAPEKHNLDEDSGDRYEGDETCHGKEGNSGTCTIQRPGFEGVARCATKTFGAPEAFCAGSMRCGSVEVGCTGVEVFAGVATGGNNEGRNYVHCRSAQGALFDSWMWCD